VKKFCLLALAVLLIAPPISRQLSDTTGPIPDCPPQGCTLN